MDELPSAPSFSSFATGWDISGRGGTYRPSAASFASAEPLPAPAEGDQALYLAPGASACQTVPGAVVLDDYVYNLTIAFGNRNDFPYPDTVTVTVEAVEDGNVTAARSWTLRRGDFLPENNAFADYTFMLDTNLPEYFAFIGAELKITVAAGTERTRAQLVIDNVRVTAEYAPITTVLPTTASPEDVRVFNPSFEANNLTRLGVTFINRAIGWDVQGTAGTFLPPTSAVAAVVSPAEGDQVLFVRPGGSARQRIGGVLAEAGRYMITFAVGRRLDRDFPLSAIAEVRAQPSGDIVASLSVTAEDVAPGAFEQGWLLFTLTGNETFIGQQLELTFRALGAANTQVLFDNVEISVQFVDVGDVSTVVVTTAGEEITDEFPECARSCSPR